jgi:hypothetical protein
MEKRVKHTAYFVAVQMPHKTADYGPSPNSLDDNGNVSFESHSNSLAADPLQEFDKPTTQLAKGSG